MINFWIQREKRKHCFDFGAIAEFGCRQLQWKYKFFENFSEIVYKPHNVLVGSVEQSLSYLISQDIEIPKPIDLLLFKDFLNREIVLRNSLDFLVNNKQYPVFVKPHDVLKAFNGTVLMNDFDAHLVLRGINCVIAVQPIVNILTEWRCYIHKGKPIACKQYMGNPLVFPDPEFINNTIGFANANLPHIAYTLDFGVNDKGETFLIEPNDAYAIGNYGVEPEDYCRMVKDRWFQITKIIK